MDKLWIMAITGSILIILLILIRTVCYGRIKNQTFVFMWLIVAVNLIIPISFDLGENIETNSVLPKDIITDFSENLISDLNSAESIVAISENNFNFSNLIFYIWISGVLLLFSYFVISALRFYIKSSKFIALSDEESLKLTENSINIKRKVIFKTSESISSPLSFGLVKPKIILPANIFLEDDKTVQFIINHELTHIKNFDIIKKYLLLLALCLHWFNPLVWIMFFIASRDIELSCDEKVLNKLHTKEKNNYAYMLLSMEENRLNSLAVNYFAKNATEERVLSIIKAKKKYKLNLLILMMFACISAICNFSYSANANSISMDKDEIIADYADDLIDVFYSKNFVENAEIDLSMDQIRLLSAANIVGFDYNDKEDSVILESLNSLTSEDYYTLQNELLTKIQNIATDLNLTFSYNTTGFSTPLALARINEDGYTEISYDDGLTWTVYTN